MIEAEDLAEVALQVAHVVADAADAELAEIGEVLPNLRGVQMELLGERLGRDRADAGAVEHVEAPQVDRQAVGRELGDLIAARFAVVPLPPLFEVFTSDRDCSKC